jgi:hypothetical protein
MKRIALSVKQAIGALFALMWLTTAACAQTERYMATSITDSQQLRIVTEEGREIVIPMATDQVGVDAVAIAPDGRRVGWLALYPNCCTSYPIPLELVVYSDGQTQRFTGAGLPVWRWSFAEGGNQIAFKQETVHGGFGTHYELVDVDSRAIIAQFEPTRGPDDQPLPGQPLPDWVRAMDTQIDP